MQLPAPVSLISSRHVVAPALARRAGLIPMTVGSQHMIPVEAGGDVASAACVARNPDDYPTAPVRLFCLHPGCAGKTWPDLDAMRAAHPQASRMIAAQEIHVYGMWSDAPQSERDRKVAQKALDEADAAHALAVEAIKAAKSVGERDLAKEDKKEAYAAALAGKARLAAVSGCIGLIAPPDAS